MSNTISIAREIYHVGYANGAFQYRDVASAVIGALIDSQKPISLQVFSAQYRTYRQSKALKSLLFGQHWTAERGQEILNAVKSFKNPNTLKPVITEQVKKSYDVPVVKTKKTPFLREFGMGLKKQVVKSPVVQFTQTEINDIVQKAVAKALGL
jgi:hypothetical protein